MLMEAKDFGAESEAVFSLIDNLNEADFALQTQFKKWTFNDILQHLHFFNVLADLSKNNEAEFSARYAVLMREMQKGRSMLEVTDEMLEGLKGIVLKEAWVEFARKMADEWFASDPKTRVKWAGPDMSLRSSISARLMETWAHAQAIYDILGVERKNKDSIKSIAVLGVNTFGWTYKVRKLPIPEAMPFVDLIAPSGDSWQWGEESETQVIRGQAEDFCQVVTQTRNIADVDMEVKGEIARQWMENAQCFAGPPNPPPAPGSRFCKQT